MFGGRIQEKHDNDDRTHGTHDDSRLQVVRSIGKKVAHSRPPSLRYPDDDLGGLNEPVHRRLLVEPRSTAASASWRLPGLHPHVPLVHLLRQVGGKVSDVWTLSTFPFRPLRRPCLRADDSSGPESAYGVSVVYLPSFVVARWSRDSTDAAAHDAGGKVGGRPKTQDRLSQQVGDRPDRTLLVLHVAHELVPKSCSKVKGDLSR